MAVELNHRRTLHSKTFQEGARLSQHIRPSPVHTPSDYAAWRRGDPVDYSDIDLDWEHKGGRRFGPKNGWFTVELSNAKLSATFTWIDGIEEIWSLDKLADSNWNRGANVQVIPRGRQLVIQDIIDDVDIIMETKNAGGQIGFEVFQKVWLAGRATDFTWDISYQTDNPEHARHERQQDSKGIDAFGRPLIFEHTLGAEDDRPGTGARKGRTFRERVTGVVLDSEWNEIKHGPQPTTPIYPIVIDKESIHNQGETSLAKPADWNDGDNSIECVGGGGGGGGGGASGGATHPGGGGGGGGGYARGDNVAWGSDPETIQVGAGGPGGATTSNGTNGTATWYRSTGFLQGAGGTGGTAISTSGGGAGGAGSGTDADATASGGSGGNGGAAGGVAAGGGGGGGGPGGDVGAGNAGTAGSAGVGDGPGGDGGAGGDGNSTDANRGMGGAGGNGGIEDGANPTAGAAGTAGTDLGENTAGTGGGGGGGGGVAKANTAGANGGAGGNYGAGGGGGGGGNDDVNGGTGGNASDGVLILTWTPGAGIDFPPLFRRQTLQIRI